MLTSTRTKRNSNHQQPKKPLVDHSKGKDNLNQKPKIENKIIIKKKRLTIRICQLMQIDLCVSKTKDQKSNTNHFNTQFSPKQPQTTIITPLSLFGILLMSRPTLFSNPSTYIPHMCAHT